MRARNHDARFATRQQERALDQATRILMEARLRSSGIRIAATEAAKRNGIGFEGLIAAKKIGQALSRIE